MSKKKDKSPGYMPAPEVQEIAEKLIEDVADHWGLAACRFEYLFTKQPEKSKGRECLATASKVTGRTAYFLDHAPGVQGWTEPAPFFLVTVWKEAWDALSEAQRVALVDHELCHCRLEEDEDGNEKMAIVGHDVEEFNAVVLRHGVWLNDVKRFMDDCQTGQSRLDLDGKKNNRMSQLEVERTPGLQPQA